MTLTGFVAAFDMVGTDIVAARNNAGATSERYAFGPGVDEPMIGYDNAGARYYFHADGHGNVVAHSGAAGSATRTIGYDEYGKPSLFNSRFLHAGKMHIGGVNAYYNNARFYDYNLGRFLQPDPVGYDDQVNLYAYARNDPINRRDPTGTYGRGDDWSRDQWNKFRDAQAYAARRLAREAANLDRAIKKGGSTLAREMQSFEKRFGKGTGTTDNMRMVANTMRGMATALRDDGSGGHVAHAVHAEKTWEQKGFTKGALANNPINSPTMYVNVSRSEFQNSGVLAWTTGHESGHSVGLVHPAIGGVVPYALGTTQERALWADLPGRSPEAALQNPDSVVWQALEEIPR